MAEKLQVKSMLWNQETSLIVEFSRGLNISLELLDTGCVEASVYENGGMWDIYYSSLKSNQAGSALKLAMDYLRAFERYVLAEYRRDFSFWRLLFQYRLGPLWRIYKGAKILRIAIGTELKHK